MIFSLATAMAQTDGFGVGVADPQEKLDVDGAVRIGTTTNTNAGTIRWTGTDFEGFNGTEWVSLTTPKEADGWSAVSTGGVYSTNWTTIPGLSLTFLLADSANVQFGAYGSMRYVGNSYCHQSFRFVVDGAGRGDAIYGNVIQSYAPSGSGDVWSSWSFGDNVTLPAGSHTITVQTRESQNGTTQCRVGQETGGGTPDYAKCYLNVSAFYR